MTEQELPFPRWMTKQLYQEYMAVQFSGLTNMFDYQRVMAIAAEQGATELTFEKVSRNDYGLILRNYDRAMELYFPEGETQ